MSGQKYNVLCDQELDGGGWTVIQQRLSGDEHFWNRTWEEYKQGFGKLSKVFSYKFELEFIRNSVFMNFSRNFTQSNSDTGHTKNKHPLFFPGLFILFRQSTD